MVGFAFVLGFLLPGYLVARLLRADRPWLLAFPVSLPVLFHCMFWVHATGARLTFWNVAAALIGTCALAALALRRWTKRGAAERLPSSEQGGPGAPGQSLTRPVFAFLSLLCAILLLRSVLEPLSGFDTYFRWDFLAAQILRLGRYDFYPPTTAADFRDYLYVDGIPPLVSFTYAWLYAAAGRYAPAVTSLLVVAQYASTVALVHRIASDIAGRRAGALAAAALGTCILYYRSVAMAQETGLTALAMVAMLYACTAGRTPIASAVLAGLCGGTAALSREYGGSFLAVGAVALLVAPHLRTGERPGRRTASAVAVFLLTAVAVAGPWYVRNALKTGNPVYSLRVAGLPVNPMYDDMIQRYRAIFGVSQWGWDGFRSMAVHLLQQGALQWTVGLVGTLYLARRRPDLVLATALVVALWLYSAGITNGGPFYTTKMLTPALAVLSIAAGCLLARAWDHRLLRRFAAASLVVASAYALLWAWTYPEDPHDLPRARWIAAGVRTGPSQAVVDADATAVRLRDRLPPGTRILSTAAYLHRSVLPHGLTVVPPWSPETAFLLDPAVHSDEARRRLLDQDIRVVEFDKASVNTLYLARDLPSDFYRNPVGWRPVLASDQGGFYELLPSPASAPAASRPSR
jgi:hypothetical protein